MLNGVPGMIGQTALVVRAVGDSVHPGRIRIRGEDWGAMALFPDTVIEPGATVVVADVERGLLVVYPTGSE